MMSSFASYFSSFKCSTFTTIGSRFIVPSLRKRRCPSNNNVAASFSLFESAGIRTILCTCANVPMSCMWSAGSRSSSSSPSSPIVVVVRALLNPANTSSSSLACLLFAIAAMASSLRCKNAPTYACPRLRISSNSAINFSSVIFTGMIIPGMSGRRGNGTASTCGCELGCPALTMIPPVLEPESNDAPDAPSPSAPRTNALDPRARRISPAPSLSINGVANFADVLYKAPLTPSRTRPPRARTHTFSAP
mmetsp:Transcript_5253/g.11586  ORF Transcript_5253/g.11586 Transcript_5253/m.11586 type:complete len:249 (+) Transcript_5253:2047-2793(+)